MDPLLESTDLSCVLQLLKEMEKDFVVQGLVRSEKGGKMLEKLGATFGDSLKIQEQNAKLRKMGMPADDENPVRILSFFLGTSRLSDLLFFCARMLSDLT